MKKRLVASLLAVLMIFTLVLPASAADQSDINKLKMYSKVADNYNRLSSLGRLIEQTDALTTIFLNSSYYGQKVENYNKAIKAYNDFVGYNEELIAQASLWGLDISDTRTILNEYSQAIDAYVPVFDDAYVFAKTGNYYYANKAISESYMPSHKCNTGMGLSQNGYNRFYALIQSY